MMLVSASPFLRNGSFLLASIAVAFCTVEARAQKFELTVMPAGSAASERPLPVGATSMVKILVRNPGAKPVGPIELTARADVLAPGKTDGWRLEDGALKTAIKEIAADTQVERELRLRVETAPVEAARVAIAVEARGPAGHVVESKAELHIADCAGAYRGRLLALRETLSQPVRDAADEIRRPDPALPAGRQFPPTGARSGDLARAERLAATFASRRGADPQMSTEWFRFLLARWVSELNAYAGQAANPGICANNYYQIAGYRQGLLPITKHIDSIRTAAAAAIEAARKEATTEAESADAIVRHLIDSAGLDVKPENGALSALAEARALSRSDRKLDAAATRQFSLAETAAWLAEADRRGQRLAQSIEQILATIARTHKESCVCAF